MIGFIEKYVNLTKNKTNTKIIHIINVLMKYICKTKKIVQIHRNNTNILRNCVELAYKLNLSKKLNRYIEITQIYLEMVQN